MRSASQPKEGGQYHPFAQIITRIKLKMAYDKNKLFEQAKEIAVSHRLFFIEDIISFLPCSKSTFYEYYPDGSDELDFLKDLLNKNKTELKVSLRANWFKSDAPTLQLALYKIIANKDELKRLSVNYVEDAEDKNEPLKIIVECPK